MPHVTRVFQNTNKGNNMSQDSEEDAWGSVESLSSESGEIPNESTQHENAENIENIEKQLVRKPRAPAPKKEPVYVRMDGDKRIFIGQNQGEFYFQTTKNGTIRKKYLETDRKKAALSAQKKIERKAHVDAKNAQKFTEMKARVEAKLAFGDLATPKVHRKRPHAQTATGQEEPPLKKARHIKRKEIAESDESPESVTV